MKTRKAFADVFCLHKQVCEKEVLTVFGAFQFKRSKNLSSRKCQEFCAIDADAIPYIQDILCFPRLVGYEYILVHRKGFERFQVLRFQNTKKGRKQLHI
ncbi:hypothetical protein B4U80_01112 [Leptotrombidium deliense]|uniref:Uncharacterized protein n=1 Tax=Leptotrombidium deliense TaxID=299467 RepID=A0A443SPC7_9ACAR|nr:hypothetical protein B4U80_01112 [Leptotrombidium deliense]